MARAEADQASMGPRFAPEDPTLPTPWKGLIDGSTGLLYYWNSETNVTQYEKPATSASPLPTGPSPSSSMSKLAQIPTIHTLPPNVPASQQPGQQMVQQAGQQVQQQQPSQQIFQQAGQLTQQQQQLSQQLPLQQSGQHMPIQQSGHQSQQVPYQQLQQMPNQQVTQQQSPQQFSHMQLQQMPYQQISYLQGQLMLRPQGQQQQGMQFSSYRQGQQSQGVPYQQGRQLQVPQIPHQQQLWESQMMLQRGQQPQGSQIPHSQGLQMMPQLLQHPQGLQIAHQQGQQSHGSHNGNQRGQQTQGQQAGFQSVEEATCQGGKQAGLSLPLDQQSSLISSNHHLPATPLRVNISPVGGHSIQPQKQLSRASPVSAQQNASSLQLRPVGIDLSYQQQQTSGCTIPNQPGHTPICPPVGLTMGYDDDQNERGRNEFDSSRRMEEPMVLLQQPRVANLPLSRSQQDMRMGDQFIPPGHSGGPNMLPQHPMPNMYSHAACPNPAPIRPSLGMFGSSDFPNISAADAYRQHHEVTAMGDNVPAPFMTFESTGFPPEILREMHLAGFFSPTPIQAQAWPLAVQNRDIVAIAKTGSGKTLGYLIPAFIHLRRCRNNIRVGPTVLVLAPTRELASQIQEEAIKFGHSSSVSCTCLYGGAPKGPQLREIERGADIIVATPGRLNDILEMKKINFCQVSFLVLDEADRMLDMGFEPQIRKIVNEIPPHRQTLMYTATWPKEVRKIAGDLLKNPVQVNIGSVDELAANKSITQHVEVVSPMDKQRRLEQILGTQERGSKIIIFCSTKRLCDQLAHSMRNFGASSIHGDKSQGERDHVLQQFRIGEAPILVATDVAARGLDIKDIRVVINYDFPTGVQDYVHRIGRTGRAGATGVSYTFFSDQDWKYAADLVKVLEGANQHVPPEVRKMAARGGPLFPRPRAGMSRWDSGDGGKWDSGGRRGVRDGPGGFGGRGKFAGGRGMRDRPGGGHGGRNDFYGGHGPRGRGFGGRGGPRGCGRHDRGPHDRYIKADRCGRYDARRGFGERSRDRAYSRSPERVRTWGYDRSRSESRSRSRSRSRSWSRSSKCQSRSQSRSRSRSYDRYERSQGQEYDHSPVPAAIAIPAFAPPDVAGFEASPVAGLEVTPVPNFEASLPVPMSPGQDNGSFPRSELTGELPWPDGRRLDSLESGTTLELPQQQAADL
ncbi:DEAD-box ATP-dependent RNA helicase 46 [Cocos nucifera]|uniref:RNA helicase n=1 Tax=Cocos nucifera TaxID=13894 RepID=A0A8K0HSM1_COCNU|nr:DEAD-box ATP-dependent RNA helicase 46 [Cocos nucifera]